jgi:hypothetical protein
VAAETLVWKYTAAGTSKVEVIRQADAFRLDWNDLVFKAAGWTTRQQAGAEDAVTPGRFTLSLDPATWAAGKYDLVVTDPAITTPLLIYTVDVLDGQFVDVGVSVARGTWHYNLTTVDEDLLLDEDGGGTGAFRAGTAFMNLWRREFGRIVVDTAAQTLTIYAKNDSTILAILPFTSEGDVQTTGPAAAP